MNPNSIELVVCDASTYTPTRNSAAVAIATWGEECILPLPHTGYTSQHNSEVVALRAGLHMALRRLRQWPKKAPITVFTDQKHLSRTPHIETRDHWHILVNALSLLPETNGTWLATLQYQIFNKRITIEWLKAHDETTGLPARYMRHADAIAYLVASGTLNVTGPLPRPATAAQQRAMIETAPINTGQWPTRTHPNSGQLITTIGIKHAKQIVRQVIHIESGLKPGAWVMLDLRSTAPVIIDDRGLRHKVKPQPAIPDPLTAAVVTAFDFLLDSSISGASLNTRLTLLTFGTQIPIVSKARISPPLIKIIQALGKRGVHIHTHVVSRKELRRNPELQVFAKAIAMTTNKD